MEALIGNWECGCTNMKAGHFVKFYFQSQPGQSWFRNVSLEKNASFRLALILNLGL